MADNLVALCWAQRRNASDFAAAAQAAVDAAAPDRRVEIQSSLVAQILDAACVGDEPSALLIDYLEHGMMLRALPINLSLQQLLDSPLVAVATPVRVRALLPVLHSFGPYVTPDNDEAAGLVLQLLTKLVEVESTGVAAFAAAQAARELLNGQAVLPLVALARQVQPDMWHALLERLRGREGQPMVQSIAAALRELGFQLENDKRIPPRRESSALHDEDVGCDFALRPTSHQSTDHDLDEAVERQRRVRPRMASWKARQATGSASGGRSGGSARVDSLSLPRRRSELDAVVSVAMVTALSAATADGQKTPAALGSAVCSTVVAVARRICAALSTAQAPSWHEARALSQLFVSTVSAAVSPTALSAAMSKAAVHQAGGFSPEKDAARPMSGGPPGRTSESEDGQNFSGQLSTEHVTSLSLACGSVFKTTANVLSAPPEHSPALPLALEILAATATALSADSTAVDPQLLRQALLGWAETPRLALATGWAQHEVSIRTDISDTSDDGASGSQGQTLRGLLFFDLSSATGRKEILLFTKNRFWCTM